MLVQDVMQRGVVIVSPGTTLAEVTRVLQRRGIRHVPVLDNGRLVGIISDRDLKAAMLSATMSSAGATTAAALDRLTAANVMQRAVVTVAPMFPVEEAARLMVTRKISALPVIEAERLVGIVTETDVLELFVRAMGVTEPSSRLDVALGDEARALARAIQAVETTGITISSVMTLKSPVTGLREAMIRVTTINPGPAIKALEALGYAVRDSWRG
jgi:acetoin utilization protein AcuB